jgi:hypothetical protein
MSSPQTTCSMLLTNITIALPASGSMKAFFEFLSMSPIKLIHSGYPLQKKIKEKRQIF